MFTMLWASGVFITLVLWLVSTLHVCTWFLDENVCPKPYPLKHPQREPRFVKYAKVYAFAPTFLGIWTWLIFSESDTGKAVIKWLNDHV